MASKRTTRTPAPEGGRLERYWAKRRFAVTPEPRGAPPRARGAGRRFVVHKHAARRLHYDFRLEHDGVLLSWSVPKGPSLVPGTRRLAVRTEDHPLEYAGFEGVIPAGEYGGGTVIVWDTGTWLPEPGTDVAAALARGKLSFRLSGRKLAGGFHLVRTRGQPRQETWLLIKRGDDAAQASGEIVEQRPESVVTRRTLEEVAAARDRVWHSNRAGDAAARASGSDRFARRTAARAEAAARRAAASVDLGALVRALPSDTPLTNLEKVLEPASGLSKGALIAYLAATSEWSLPHIAGRPLTLRRFPDGVGGRAGGFFQKHHRPGTPRSLTKVAIPEDDGTTKQYMMLHDLKGLIATGQLGAIELHTWGCHGDEVEKPDLLVLDLDPDPAIGWAPVIDAALGLRARLAEVGLESFVKTTGGKGLHVCAPIVRTLDWDTFKGFAKALVERHAAAQPTRFVTTVAKAQRRGKIFLDYLRNGRGATFVAPYSVRARAGAPVATPVSWDELAAGVDPASFTVATVPPRLGRLAADPWAAMTTLRQRVTAAALRRHGL
jgi:bifunctional non-homologous end joining protein LigD